MQPGEVVVTQRRVMVDEYVRLPLCTEVAVQASPRRPARLGHRSAKPCGSRGGGLAAAGAIPICVDAAHAHALQAAAVEQRDASVRDASTDKRRVRVNPVEGQCVAAQASRVAAQVLGCVACWPEAHAVLDLQQRWPHMSAPIERLSYQDTIMHDCGADFPANPAALRGCPATQLECTASLRSRCDLNRAIGNTSAVDRAERSLAVANAWNESTRRRATHCSLLNLHSQFGEDRMLLPTLLGAAEGRPGTFVEIGAFTGVMFSNTVMLERCWNWTGALIEANPKNFNKLRRAVRPRSRAIHSAVCGMEGRTEVMVEGHAASGIATSETVQAACTVLEVGKNKAPIRRRCHGTVRVPCAPLSVIMARASLTTADFLSLDVEGAEADVLATVNPGESCCHRSN